MNLVNPESIQQLPERSVKSGNIKTFIFGAVVGGTVVGLVCNRKIEAIKYRYEQYLDAVARHGEHHV